MNRPSLFNPFILTVFCTIFFTIPNNAAPDGEENSIIRVMQKFQEGYTQRDTSVINDFVRELFTPDIFVIGTGAREWPQGIDEVKKLVGWDWKRWGDLRIDIGKLHLSVKDEICWFAVPGTLSYHFESEEYIYEQYGLNDVNRIINEEKSNKAKLLDIIQDASDILLEVETAGTEFIYPIRLAGTLVKIDGHWKFRQMIFSYPYPRQLIVDKNR